MNAERDRGEYQREVGLMVQREVMFCLSSLVSSMFELGESCPDYEDLQTVAECKPDDDDIREALEADDEMVIGFEHGVYKVAGKDVGGYFNWYGIRTKDHEKIRIYHAQLREVCTQVEPTHGGYLFVNIDENDSDCWGDDDEIVGKLCDSEADAHEAAVTEAGMYLSADEESEALREYAEMCRIEVDPREVYEHWVVSSWLAGQLEERGEAVTEWMGLHIWGRTTTGQSILLDRVICEIYDDLHAPSEG